MDDQPIIQAKRVGEGEFEVSILVRCDEPGVTAEEIEEHIAELIDAEDASVSDIPCCIAQLAKSSRGYAALRAFTQFTEDPCMSGLDAENMIALQTLLVMDADHHLLITDSIQNLL